MKALSSPLVRARVTALLAEARGVRWDILTARAAVVLGVVAALGSLGAALITFSGLVPGRFGVILAAGGGLIGAATTAAAALQPRMTEAAGLLRTAHDQQTPLLKVLPDVLRVLCSASRIVRDAEADAARREREAEAEREREMAQKSRAAIVDETAVAVLDMLRTSSFRQTAQGLVEEGVLAAPPSPALLPAPPPGGQEPGGQAPQDADDDDHEDSDDAHDVARLESEGGPVGA